MKIVALIPARSGSKELINKNIKEYKGIPLLVHSINVALQSKYIKDVYVSTDSEEYQEISIKYGSKVTPLRPKEISDDLSPDIDTFHHFIQMHKDKNLFIQDIPDIIVHLRPTYPNRTVEMLDKAIEVFLENYESYDSLRSVIKIDKTPYKMYYIQNNHLIPYLPNHPYLIEPFNQARQNFPETFLHNGCIDIVKTNNIIKNNLLSGLNIYPFVMDENEMNDIDNLSDFILSENK